MTWKLSVISGDVEYDISDGATYVLTGLDGIGMSPTKRITEQGSQQHGASDLGFRLQPRRIALALLAKGGDDAAWLERRNALLRIFRPSDTPLKLRLTSGETVRQIDCYYSGEMGMPAEGDTGPRWQRAAIELIAPDPTWYDPDGEVVAFSLGGGGLLAIPLTVPMAVGASTIDQSIPVSYDGTWDAYPIITLQGPMTNPVIRNQTMGDKLDFAAVTIPAGETYVIDCRYGYKTVTRQSDGANRIQDLTSDSNLATFRIGAHPDVPGGYNSIRVSASGLTTTSYVFIQFQTRYVGV